MSTVVFRPTAVSDSAAVSHSSSLCLVTRTRSTDRAIASTDSSAWCNRNTSVNAATTFPWTNASTVSLAQGRRPAAFPRHSQYREKQVRVHRDQQGRERGRCPVPHGARQVKPTGQQQQQQARFEQAAPQVIEDLPPRDQRDRVGDHAAVAVRNRATAASA